VPDAPDPELRVGHESTEYSLVISLVGDLDHRSAPLLDLYVRELRPLDRPVTLDVAGVGFVDSAGLSALLAARRAAIEDVDETVRIVGCGAGLRQLLQVTGLSTVLRPDG
jgi:anti-sigma B factor antagonist